MITKPLPAIDARITELETELAAFPAYRELVILRDARSKLGAINGQPAAIPMQPVQPKRPTIRRGGSQPKGKVAQHEAAALAVKAAGHPLETTELLEALPKHGAEIGGKNREKNLTSVLSTRGELKSIKWRGRPAWWLKDREPPNDSKPLL